MSDAAPISPTAAPSWLRRSHQLSASLIYAPTDRAAAAIAAIKQLALDVKIPAGLEQLGVKADDFDTLASNALKDACGFTNPKQASHEEIVAIFRAAM